MKRYRHKNQLAMPPGAEGKWARAQGGVSSPLLLTLAPALQHPQVLLKSVCPTPSSFTFSIVQMTVSCLETGPVPLLPCATGLGGLAYLLTV